MNNKKYFWIANQKKNGKYYIYILRCCGGMFYVGMTEDLIKRIYSHTVGFGAEFTKKYPPCELVHLQFSDNYKKASSLEMELKRFVTAGWRDFNLPDEYTDLFYRISAMCHWDVRSSPDKSNSCYEDCVSMIDIPPFPRLCVTRNIN